KEDKKFAGSRLDEAYYYYKKAMHEGENYDVQLAKVKKIKKEIAKLEPIIKEREQALEKAESALLELKARQIKLEEELRELTFKRDQLERQMDFYKPFPFFWKIAEIKQTVIPGARHNNFSEITYKVDRCMTCHISYKDTYYQDFDHPLKTHPNLDILIKEHPPQKTGCTWCHLGQGPATWPVEDAHGSHHETDQTPELNEPILKGHFMESNCRNCHAQVVKL
ncbi:MAG: cytochrome C, partial [Nitrospinaceae bacterium]|nr:cytochrome C [Nitrospinaceae bacterium]NIR57421.1 cytochrome C [Nitrospinaceae bacterium]NIS87879.1 cytochrome C [Nitrospinaceae bacterium]NIT84749.1 cytochrome C [Nitrospinaceae bacterium]NIU46924.1 cytochrome C [Nitrospinaceae bacterium]